MVRSLQKYTEGSHWQSPIINLSYPPKQSSLKNEPRGLFGWSVSSTLFYLDLGLSFILGTRCPCCAGGRAGRQAGWRADARMGVFSCGMKIFWEYFIKIPKKLYMVRVEAISTGMILWIQSTDVCKHFNSCFWYLNSSFVSVSFSYLKLLDFSRERRSVPYLGVLHKHTHSPLGLAVALLNRPQRGWFHISSTPSPIRLIAWCGDWFGAGC